MLFPDQIFPGQREEDIYLMCRAVIPPMQQQGGGSIVNIGSGAGHGKPNMAAYAASKRCAGAAPPWPIIILPTMCG